jgi:hypothetical protein
MRSEELIAALVRDLKPAPPLADPAIRAMRWLAAVPILLAVGALAWGLRSDRWALAQWAELQLVILALATAVAAAFAALRLAVPGARDAVALAWIPMILTALWIIALSLRIAFAGGSMAGSMTWPYPACLIKVASIAAMPAVLLIVMLRRAGPLRLALAGGLGGLAAGAVGSLGAQLACPNGNPAHALLGHAAPMVMLALLAAVFGRALLSPRSQRRWRSAPTMRP